MTTHYHRLFKKTFKKLPKKIQEQFYERLELFLQNPSAPRLRNHALDGEFQNFRSINITGDYRAIFEEIEDKIVFYDIGTHAQLYG